MSRLQMRRISAFVLLVLIIRPFFLFSGQEIVDRIVALVNEQVITLTDVRIADAFGIHDEELEGTSGNRRAAILEKLIDQKLGIQFSSEEVSVSKEELDAAVERIVEKMGIEQLEQYLGEFGLEWEDLRERLWEKILYRKILSQRFSRVIIVSLQDIEDYYQKTYLPSQKDKGLEPQPMVEILDQIEFIIKKERIQAQVEDWLAILKKKADIQIKEGNLKERNKFLPGK